MSCKIVKKPMKGSDGDTLGYLVIGACNFVPRKKKGTTLIVPLYKNKWERVTEFWFYYRVVSDKQVAQLVKEGYERARALVSAMVPFVGVPQLSYDVSSDDSVRACEAFELTSSNQTSHDLVEEQDAFGFSSLAPGVITMMVKEVSGYVC